MILIPLAVAVVSAITGNWDASAIFLGITGVLVATHVIDRRAARREPPLPPPPPARSHVRIVVLEDVNRRFDDMAKRDERFGYWAEVRAAQDAHPSSQPPDDVS